MIYVSSLIIHGQDRKNALEEYAYDTRGKLDDRYRAYVQQPEKEKLVVALQDAEDWLYTEEGEDAKKSAYVSRLDALKVLGEPSPTVTVKTNPERRGSASFEIRSTSTCRKRHQLTKSTRTSTRKTSMPLSRRLRRSKSGWMTKSPGNRSAPRMWILC